jgi:hypothetical protein
MRTARAGATGLALLLLGILTGCPAPLVDWVDNADSLDFAQRRYNQLLRWGEFEESSRFVHPDARQAYLAAAPEFEDVRFTDYEVTTFELEETLDKAHLTVSFSGYDVSALIERKTSMQQEWVRDPETMIWQVRPALEGFQQALLGATY